ncbi:MAG: hypothetical protein ABFD80_11230 [Acidobacteriota bacterium]
MKPYKTAVVFLLFAACALGFALQAPAQEKKPQLFFIEDYAVKPGMVGPFEEAVRELVASIMTPYAWPWPMDTYATEDFHYYFLYPFENMAQVDTAFTTFSQIIGKLGEQKWEAFNKKMGAAVEYYKQGTIYYLPELSYAPEKPRLKPDEMKFIGWGFCYILSGKEREFEDELKRMVALYKAKKVPQGFKSWAGGMGVDSPFYFYSETAKSAADLCLTEEKVMKLVDPEATAIWKAMLGLMRKSEYKMGAHRPDLSYAPAVPKK